MAGRGAGISFYGRPGQVFGHKIDTPTRAKHIQYRRARIGTPRNFCRAQYVIADGNAYRWLAVCIAAFLSAER